MDGSITIDTKIDSKGFGNGVKKITSVFGLLANTIKGILGKFGLFKNLLSEKMKPLTDAWGALTGKFSNFVAFASKGVGAIGSVFGKIGNIIKGIGKIMAAAFIGSIVAIKGIMGQFDFLKSSIGDKIKPLSDAWGVLKGQFVNFIATALVPMIPYLVMAVQWFTKLLTTATQIIAALFGMKQTVGGIAENTKKTEKAAKGSLAAFDQISVLQQPDDTAGGDTPMITPESLTVADDLLAKVQAIKDAIMEWWNDPIGKLKETWGKIVDWFKENVITPISEWWNNTWIGQLLSELWDIFTDTWTKIKNRVIETWENIKEKVAQVIQGIKDVIEGFAEGDWAKVWQGFKDIVEGVFGGIWEIIKGFFEDFEILSDGIGKTLETLFPKLMEKIKEFVGTLKESFNNGLEWIHDKFMSVFEGIANFVKGIINTIIGFINSLIQSVGTGINAIIYSANVVGSVVPGFTPIEYVAVPQIPKLATGAVIPPNAEFAAILGDQTRGRNIEAPEDLIRQIIREEMSGASGDVTVPFTIELDGEVIYKSVKRASTRHGKSLIAGGAA